MLPNCKRILQLLLVKTLDTGTFREVVSHQSDQVPARRPPLDSGAWFNTQNTRDVRL